MNNSVPAFAKARGTPGESSFAQMLLVDHGIDVAAVAETLLRLPLVRKRLGSLAGRPLSDVDVARLCFFVGLHDAGKANHGFQARLRNKKPDAGHIGPLWAILKPKPLYSPAHRAVQRDVRRALMASRWNSWFDDREQEGELWGVILAHHGSSPIDTLRLDPHLWCSREGFNPASALAELAEMLAGMFPAAFSDESDHLLPGKSRFHHALAGLVTLADWLGSDDTVFGYPVDGAPSGPSRIPWAREQAADLLRRRSLNPLRARDAAHALATDFTTLFREHSAPRPAQAALLTAPLPRPGQVTVLEAETGSGKTEAALIHFLRLFQAGEVDGLYFALPTRAAAVQIHRRIKNIIRGWLGDAAPPVGLAVPGYLRVDDDDGERLPETFRVQWPDGTNRDRTWFVENAKRYLSGAVMVGTVDQLLLGGLRVRHAPFRAGPMLRLLLCVDEVHASDAYMTTLLRNVLDQHRAAGGHSLLMSATLGSLARLRLLNKRVEAHQSPDESRAALLAYPSLQRSGEELQRLPQADQEPQEKCVGVELLDPDADSKPLLKRLKAAVESGAAVLFIRNRVDDARKTVEQLEEMGTPLLRCHGVTAPHHGRFAPEDRRLLDDALERAFPSHGPRGGVAAVTTQTAEQSLDIDADWLVTDAVPGDVLLQRIGRLHRHRRPRPVGFEAPRVTVLSPTPERIARLINSCGDAKFPPHARGWTERLPGLDRARGVSPARAGMDRRSKPGKARGTRFPRTRGDGPATPDDIRTLTEFPPHARGWTCYDSSVPFRNRKLSLDWNLA